MAIRGQRPRSAVLRLVSGDKRDRTKRPAAGAPIPTGRPVPPEPLTGTAADLWRANIEPAFWLTAADSQAAFMWVHMSAEYVASTREGAEPMLAARISNLRALSSELGFNPTARARIGTTRNPDVADPAEAKFFS